MATLQVLPLLVVLLFFLFRFQTSQKTLFTFGLCSVQFFLMLQLFLERRRSTTSVRFCVINRRFFVNSAGLVSTDSIGTIATFLLHLISHSNHLGSNFSQDRPRILLDSRRLFGGGGAGRSGLKRFCLIGCGFLSFIDKKFPVIGRILEGFSRIFKRCPRRFETVEIRFTKGKNHWHRPLGGLVSSLNVNRWLTDSYGFLR